MQSQRERHLVGGFLSVMVGMVLVTAFGAAEAVPWVGLFGVLALLVVATSTRPRRRRRRDPEDPREVLERRLANGEITCEEYFERDAILRSAPLEMPRTRELTRR
ncbi:MAG TPA: hypothetical protein VIK95_15575 [Egibacteraceae bacterium]